MFPKRSILPVIAVAAVMAGSLAAAAPGVWTVDELLERSDVVLVATLQDVEWECVDERSPHRCGSDRGWGDLAPERFLRGSSSKPVSIYWRNGAVICLYKDYRPLEGRRGLWFLRKSAIAGHDHYQPRLVIPFDDETQVRTALDRFRRKADSDLSSRIQAIVEVLEAPDLPPDTP